MYKLLKIAVVMLALVASVYTDENPLAQPSTCKCRHKNGSPDNYVTQMCCNPISNNGTTYGCTGDLVYSHKHHRCDCQDEYLWHNSEEWSKCCVAHSDPMSDDGILEEDRGYDCTIG